MMRRCANPVCRRQGEPASHWQFVRDGDGLPEAGTPFCTWECLATAARLVAIRKRAFRRGDLVPRSR